MDLENYTNEMLEDITNWIDYNIDYNDFEDLEALREYLNDNLWAEDDITGNGPRGHYYPTLEGAKNMFIEDDGFENFYKVRDEFCTDKSEVMERFLKEDWHWFDSSIRCYLLRECIDSVLEDIEDDFNEAHGSQDVDIESQEEDYDEGFDDIEESLRRSRRRRY
jgi:hypothetical protein